jgi:hypothetical protein
MIAITAVSLKNLSMGRLSVRRNNRAGALRHRELRPCTYEPFSTIVTADEQNAPEKEDFPMRPTVPVLAL